MDIKGIEKFFEELENTPLPDLPDLPVDFYNHQYFPLCLCSGASLFYHMVVELKDEKNFDAIVSGLLEVVACCADYKFKILEIGYCENLFHILIQSSFTHSISDILNFIQTQAITFSEIQPSVDIWNTNHFVATFNAQELDRMLNPYIERHENRYVVLHRDRTESEILKSDNSRINLL